MKNMSLPICLFSIFASIALSFSNANAATMVRVDHDYHSILRDIPLDNACLTKNEVRSITPVRTCVQLEASTETHRGNFEPIPTWSCKAFANVTLVYPRTVETQACVETTTPRSAESSPVGACTKWSITTLTLPRSIDVRVTPILTRDAPDPASRTETIFFPDCQ